MHKLVVICFIPLALALSCTGETAKDATSAVVGKAIEVGKGTATGIASGVEAGRKNAESADGAIVVSNAEELAQHGGAALGEVTAAGDAAATVAVLFENKGDQPMRVTKIDVLALDGGGVVIPVQAGAAELTVPAHAKAKYTFTVSGASDSVKTVRVYGKDIAK